MSDEEFWSFVFGDCQLLPSDLADMTYSDLYYTIKGRIKAKETKDREEWLKTCYLVASIANMMGAKVSPSELMPFEEFTTPEPPPVPQYDWDRLEALMQTHENGRG